jgi:hypothetical protein
VNGVVAALAGGRANDVHVVMTDDCSTRFSPDHLAELWNVATGELGPFESHEATAFAIRNDLA